ncbi:MAG: potassium channel family protein [Candidatus Binataceae bacterium]
MSPARRFVYAIVGIAIIVLCGAVGFRLIEGMTLIDALYMSVITVSTVGFEEVKPLSPTGRLFTIGLIIVGVGSVFYLLSTAVELVLEGSLQDFFGKSAMHRKIHNLEKHVIVCGFGRLGRAVVEELKRHDVPMVVIDSNPAKEAELTAMGVLYVIGSALEESVMEQAAVHSARSVVVATASDADNVYITLSVREKNPQVFIHARGDSEAGLRRLRLAGADQVLSAYQWGGMRIAASILRPSVVNFLELSVPGRESEIDLEEIRIEPGNSVAGMTIGAIEHENARLRVVALKRGDEPILMIPDRDSRIEVGDFLVVIGESTSLKRLAGI